MIKHQQYFSTLIITLVSISFFPSLANSATSLKSHTHGLSELVIAMEGNELEIQFVSPAINLLGFEHKARTEKQKAMVQSAKLQLHKYEEAFLFENAACQHISTSTDLSGLVNNDEHKHDEHKHDEHNHDEHKHDEHKHDEHKHDEHDHGDTQNHFEIMASYKYRCDKPSALNIGLFKIFPGIEKIQVVWLIEQKQGMATLNPNESRVKFD